MISASMRVIDPGLIDAYAEVCHHAPDFVNVVTTRTVNSSRDEFLHEIQAEPGPVSTPIQWESDKQRRYVMMMKRQGKMPLVYPRSHKVSKGWHAEVVYIPDELSQIEVWNEEESATFVEGLRQQRWMKNTGWLYAPDVIAKWQGIFTDLIEIDLIKAWYSIEPGDVVYA